MGSLDAFLVSLGFATLGEAVSSIRIVQAILFLLVVGTGFWTAWRLSGRMIVATVAALSVAVGPVLLAVYTTATLGGYNETLLFGNLMLLLAYEVTHDHTRSWWRWLLLGIIAGLGWWTNGLVIAFGMPVALLLLIRAVRPYDPNSAPPLPQRLFPLGIALAGFFIGSAPWWLFNFQNDWQALAFYFVRTDAGNFAGNAVPEIPFRDRMLGLALLGLPTLVGMRFPWNDFFFVPLIGALVFAIYCSAFYRLLRGAKTPDGTPPLKPDGRALILGLVGLFGLVFVASKFSIDPTGRYFVPLVFPVGIIFGTLIDTLPAKTRIIGTPQRRRYAQIALVALVLGYFAVGQLVAVNSEIGLTTQFNLDSHIPNDHDAELIAFLETNDLYAGYSTYWVTFRLAFLSDERLQYSSALPYKPSLQYTPADERYPAYKDAADRSDRIAYITAKVDEVRDRLESVFADAGVEYDLEIIGEYYVYYNFSPDPPRPPLNLMQ
jgi:hypothetical protein